jgi:dTDP-glucose pyrophosphorylase
MATKKKEAAPLNQPVATRSSGPSERDLLLEAVDSLWSCIEMTRGSTVLAENDKEITDILQVMMDPSRYSIGTNADGMYWVGYLRGYAEACDCTLSELLDQMDISTAPVKTSEATTDGVSEYVSVEDCKRAGKHLKECDKDGYCNSCGDQAVN